MRGKDLALQQSCSSEDVRTFSQRAQHSNQTAKSCFTWENLLWTPHLCKVSQCSQGNTPPHHSLWCFRSAEGKGGLFKEFTIEREGEEEALWREERDSSHFAADYKPPLFLCALHKRRFTSPLPPQPERHFLWVPYQEEVAFQHTERGRNCMASHINHKSNLLKNFSVKFQGEWDLVGLAASSGWAARAHTLVHMQRSQETLHLPMSFLESEWS